jgi:polysaccharide biosynthesis protein PslH
MRILQLCKKFPYPLKDGESIAITYLAKALNELGHEVSLLAMNTSKHFYDVAKLPADFNHYHTCETVYVDNRIKPLKAFANLFSKESYHLSRFIQASYAKRLEQILSANTFDMVILETVYLAPYIDLIRAHTQAIVVMRAHNVEHEIWERLTAKAHPLKRLYLQQITPRLRQFEIKSLNKYDLMAGITMRDIDCFRNLGMDIPAIALPVGLDTRCYMADESSYHKPLSIGFIGSLDWMPNIEGLKWFLDEVWHPLIHPEFPELQLHIAGRNTPTWLKTLKKKGIHVHGEVPDASSFIKEHSAMIVPLISGGGMRVKILESMALGRINITTTVGTEGIDAQHTKELLIADTAQDFLEAIRFCVKHPRKCLEIGQRAQVFCAKNYDNLQLAHKLVEAYQSIKNETAKHLMTEKGLKG